MCKDLIFQKNLLIITGYLLCDIVELRKDYIDILRNCDDQDIINNITTLEETIKTNDIIEQKRYDNIKTKERKKSINIKDIIVALKMNIIDNKKEKADNTLEEVKYYLQCLGIA